MPRVVLFFLLFFVLELFVLITIGSRIGALMTISLMFLAMVIGGVLIKFRARSLIQTLQSGDGRKVLEGKVSLLMLPLAGILFIIPGFISDILAVLILIPGLDKLIASLFIVKFSNVYFGNGKGFSSHTFYSQGTFHEQSTDDGTVIDGTYSEVPEHSLEHKSKEPTKK